MFKWLFKPKRIHACFSHPCVVVSVKGMIIDYNKEFAIIFGESKHKLFSNLVNITHNNNTIIASNLGIKWELNYFQTGTNEYHVLFFNYDDYNFLSNIPAPLGVVDKHGNIIHHNKDFSKHFNITDQKHNLSSFIKFNPTDLKTVETTCELTTNDGTDYTIKYKPTACNMWIISVTDKTEIQLIKNKMIKAQHLQSLGQLIASVSHDFNNMFTATNGFCEMLLEKTKNTEIYEDILEIFKHIENAQDLSKQLVKFVSEQDTEYCNPYETLYELQRILSKLVGDNITMEFDIEKINKTIKLSNSNLKRIIINLVINSRDAIKEFGTISISLKLGKRNNIIIVVKDNGMGIPKEHLANICKPFFSTKQDGTGLGLSNVSQLMNQCGGTLNIRSSATECVGTEITMNIPTIQTTHSNKTDKLQNTSIKQIKILLVEDEPGVRTIVSKSLKAQNHEVYESSSGIDALKQLQKKKFDLLITDASLPELSGDKLCHEIQKLGIAIKILIISGYPEELIQQKCDYYDAFLGKPFNIAQLLSTIHQLFS
ncbi:MAG: response regulator [Alphaproteobacteria bacterium]|nr:MAG: response regulator [Alphaproteobacteria bacterium]